MSSHGVTVEWYKATINSLDYVIVYNIYYSTNKEDVFSEGVKYVVTNPDQTSIYISNLTPGDVYYFAVRASTMPINHVNLNNLPESDGLKTYPESSLLSNISATDTLIPIMDVDTFPSYGVVQIGSELIGYSGINQEQNALISSLNLRGLFQTKISHHNIDGYDGYLYRDPIVRFFKGFEDENTSTALQEANFKYPHYAYNDVDGYKYTDDLVHTIDENRDDDGYCEDDCSKIELIGYKRTHPSDLLSGKNVGSYYGGEHYCVDSNTGVGRRVRGLGIDDFQNSREEILLETTGEPMILLRRQVSGYNSMNYDNHRENTAYRGFDNHGTAFVQGYEQFFNKSRSDGRILVRFDPTQEDVERNEHGLENIFIPNCWTLSRPTIKDGDVLIRFNRDGTEEFRYEIINVTRNRTLLNNVGAQKFTAVRIRKTDPIYQFLTIRDTSHFPSEIVTSVGVVDGVPHTHTIVINEGITSLTQVNQNTNISAKHSHVVRGGIVEEALGHTHSLIL